MQRMNETSIIETTKNTTNNTSNQNPYPDKNQAFRKAGATRQNRNKQYEKIKSKRRLKHCKNMWNITKLLKTIKTIKPPIQG